jgi:hypothetical protein
LITARPLRDSRILYRPPPLIGIGTARVRIPGLALSLPPKVL